jgi:hypothetical protein
MADPFKTKAVEEPTALIVEDEPSDGQSGEGGFDFRFESLELDAIDRKAFTSELLGGLRANGASEATVQMLKIRLRAGSVVAEVRGADSILCDLRCVADKTVTVLGCQAEPVEVQSKEELAHADAVVSAAFRSSSPEPRARRQVGFDATYYTQHVLPTIGVSEWEACSRARFSAHHRERAEERLASAVEGDSMPELVFALSLAKANAASAEAVWFAEVCRRRRATTSELRSLLVAGPNPTEGGVRWHDLWGQKASVLQELIVLARKEPRKALKEVRQLAPVGDSPPSPEPRTR